MSGILSSEMTLSQTSVSHSLARSGWFRRRFSKPPARFVGIDFTGTAIHIATLEESSSGRKTSLSNRHRHRHHLPIDPFATVTPESIKEMIDLMCDALPRCVDGEKNVAMLAVPTSWIYYESASFAAQSSETTMIPAELQLRCDQMFGSSAFRSTAHVSTWPIAKGSPVRMVAATAKDTICDIAQRITNIGYQIQGIAPHGIALALAVETLTTLNPACMILLNRGGGLISISQDGHCGFSRTLPTCPREHVFSNDVEALYPWIDQVASETIATMQYSVRHQVPIDPDAMVMLCGELAQVPDIDLALADRLRRPVATWTLVQGDNRSTETPDGESACNDSEMAVAYSLAFAAAKQSSQNQKRRALA